MMRSARKNTELFDHFYRTTELEKKNHLMKILSLILERFLSHNNTIDL